MKISYSKKWFPSSSSSSLFLLGLLLLLFLLATNLFSGTQKNELIFCDALMERISNLTFGNTSGMQFFSTSIISPSTVPAASAFAVFAAFSQPSRLVRVAIPSVSSSPAYFTNTSATANLTLNTGEDYVRCSVISPDGTLGFFGTESLPTSYIIKVNLSASNGLTRMGSLPLSIAGQTQLWSAVMTPDGVNSLWGTWQSPGTIIKLRNADMVLELTLTLGSGENKLQSACITPDGTTALFGCWTGSPAGIIVKISVTTFTRIGSLTLNTGENYPLSAVMSTDGTFALFGMDTSDVGRIVKVRVSNLTRVQGLNVTSSTRLASAVMSADGTHAYFGSSTVPGVISQIALSDPSSPSQISIEATTVLNSGENSLWTAVSGKNLGANSDFVFFAAYTQPASLVQVFTAATTTTTTSTTTTSSTTSTTSTTTTTSATTTTTTPTSTSSTTTATTTTTPTSTATTTIPLTSTTSSTTIGPTLGPTVTLLTPTPTPTSTSPNVTNITVTAVLQNSTPSPTSTTMSTVPISITVPAAASSSLTSEQTIGIIVGCVVGGLIFLLLLVCLFIPWCKGQPGFCCAVNSWCKAAFVCADDEEAVQPVGEPHFHHPHMQAKLREMLYVENESQRRGGAYFFPSDGYDETVFFIPEDSLRGQPINYKLTPAMRRRIRLTPAELNNREGKFDSFADSPNRGSNNNNNSENRRRDSVSPVRIDQQKNNSGGNRITWTRGVDMKDSNTNRSIVAPSSQPQQQSASYFYKSPANFRNNNNNGGGFSSVERNQQLQSYHRNDENTGYYFNADGTKTTSPLQRNVQDYNNNNSDFSMNNNNNNNNNQLPLSYAHRSPFPFSRDVALGTRQNEKIENDKAAGTVSTRAWSTPSGRTYGAVRSPLGSSSSQVRNNEREQYSSLPRHRSQSPELQQPRPHPVLAFAHVEGFDHQENNDRGRSRSEEMVAPMPHYSYGRNDNEQDRRQNYYDHPSLQQPRLNGYNNNNNNNNDDAYNNSMRELPSSMNARAVALRGVSASSTSTTNNVNRYSPSTFQKQQQQYAKHNNNQNNNEEGGYYYQNGDRRNYVSPSSNMRQRY